MTLQNGDTRVSLAFTTTTNGYPGLHVRQKCLKDPKHRLVEAIEPCPVHSDLFEGIVSLRHTVTGAGEKIYVYLVIDFGALERTVSFSLGCTECDHSHLGIHSLQHPILLIDPAPQRQQRSPPISARKGTHSLPVALARPPNLVAAP